ncbi:MAG: Flp pilus assembly complex ATPase component TadA [Planctomycetes bacterium]|nr:Flp pilus assembly complex ATPase component TadA [Planctomycetota bacterium]
MSELLIRNRNEKKVMKAVFSVRKISIGSDETNAICLKAPSVSRHHCVLELEGGTFVLHDLGSKNGTYVGEDRVTEPVEIGDGGRFAVGPFDLIFKWDGRIPEEDDDGGNGHDARKGSRPAATLAAPGGRSIGDTMVMRRGKGGVPVPLSQTARPDQVLEEEPEEEPPEAEAEAEHGEEAEPGEGGGADVNDAGGDFQTFKRRIHELLLTDKRMKQVSFADSAEKEVRDKTVEVIKSILSQHLDEMPEGCTEALLIKELLADVLGLGPLEDLLGDDGISEVMVNNWDRVFIERRGGHIELTEKKFIDNDHVTEVIRRIIAPIGRRVNESTPLVDARLRDGSRVNAVIPPIAVSGPSLTIRKFTKKKLTIEDMVKLGSLTANAGRFLKLAVEARQNILVSGGTGSGKTTLLNCLASFISVGERVVTVEDVSELRLPHPNLVTLETRPPNLEGTGEIPIRRLVVNALRMRPDRIIVGECRGGEAFDMLQAMNTGHDGSMTTVHANTPKDAISRAENMVLMAGMDLPAKAIREQIASAVNVIVQIARLSDGSRRIMKITEITGIDGDVCSLMDIFAFEQKGLSQEGKVIGGLKCTKNVPKLFEKMRNAGQKPDMSIIA